MKYFCVFCVCTHVYTACYSVAWHEPLQTASHVSSRNARAAQAIRTTTSVLEAAIAQAIPAGLSTEVADSLARQRCEQTPLLSAVTWALRQVRQGPEDTDAPADTHAGRRCFAVGSRLAVHAQQQQPVTLATTRHSQLCMPSPAARCPPPTGGTGSVL